MDISSKTTFLYFNDLKKARHFFDRVLKLEVVYDPIWACVWRTGVNSFIGAVDVTQGAIEVHERGGVLVSFTVPSAREVYKELTGVPEITEMSPLRYREDIGLWTFLVTGPEGYVFEFQEFTSQELRKVF